MNTNQVSAAVLAGGYSTRMGCDKALLKCGDKSFLEVHVSRLKALGIGEILLSGTPHRIPGSRNVEDYYPHRGPLSGVHTCMRQAAFSSLLVISVDVPLIPRDALHRLVIDHEGGITALKHSGRIEPLIAVYDCNLAEAAERILKSDHHAIRQLFDIVPVRHSLYQGDERLLSGCNTPEEYAQVLACHALLSMADRD